MNNNYWRRSQRLDRYSEIDDPWPDDPLPEPKGFRNLVIVFTLSLCAILCGIAWVVMP